MADEPISIPMPAEGVVLYSLRLSPTTGATGSQVTLSLAEDPLIPGLYQCVNSGSHEGLFKFDVLYDSSEIVADGFVVLRNSTSVILIGSDFLTAGEISSLISSAIVTAGVKVSPQGFPSRLFRGDERSDENGSAILIKLFDDDDPPNVITGVGTLNFSDAGCVGAVGLRRPDSSVADVTLSAEWDAVGEQWKVEYGETALDDFPDGNNVLAEWALTIDWSGGNRISPADGTTRIVNKFTA